MISVKNVSLALLVVLIVIQFFRIDKEIPAVDKSKDFIEVTNPPLEIAKLIKTTCYDCHSYETQYPWYTNVAPLSWWIADHIEDGRGHLNFSIWTEYPEKRALHKLEEFYEEVEEGEMPLSSYTLAHGEAKLSKEDIDKLVAWVKSIPGVLEQ